MCSTITTNDSVSALKESFNDSHHGRQVPVIAGLFLENNYLAGMLMIVVNVDLV